MKSMHERTGIPISAKPTSVTGFQNGRPGFPYMRPMVLNTVGFLGPQPVLRTQIDGWAGRTAIIMELTIIMHTEAAVQVLALRSDVSLFVRVHTSRRSSARFRIRARAASCACASRRRDARARPGARSRAVRDGLVSAWAATVAAVLLGAGVSMARQWCACAVVLVAAAATGEGASDGVRAFMVTEDDGEDCIHSAEVRSRNRLVTTGSINRRSKAPSVDLGCQAFDGTGLWVAPDGIECGEMGGVCSSGFCVGKMQLAASFTFVAASEPTNMLIAPAVPPSGSIERARLEKELTDLLSRVLSWSVRGLRTNFTSTTGQLPSITTIGLEITAVDATSMEASSPPVFYVSAEFDVITGPVCPVDAEDCDRREMIVAAIAAAVATPRQATELDVGVKLGSGSLFSATFDEFDFQLVEGRTWVRAPKLRGLIHE
eukprot:COSAG02_NODE_6428_length_3576_cov_1.563129_2_plen_431_part_00